MLDALTHHINDASLGNFAQQAVKEPCPFKVVAPNAKLLRKFRLRSFQESEQARFINGVLAAVLFAMALLEAIVVN